MKKYASWLVGSAALVLIAGSVRADSMIAETPAPAPVIAPAMTGSRGTILKNNVNVRSRADKNSEVIAQLKKGATVDVKERKGEWVQIPAPANAKCYVSAKLVKDDVATADATHVRCGPGMNYKDIGKLAKGEKVEVVGTKGEWTQIRPTDGCSGWVAASLIEISEPTPPPAPMQTSEITPAPLAPPAPAPVQVADHSDEVLVQYVAKDGYFAVVQDAKAPAPYALMTADVMGRQYIIAYLEGSQTNLARFDGKHVRITGNQRWKRGDRYPVITLERCEMDW